jgi:hypothetical protein
MLVVTAIGAMADATIERDTGANTRGNANKLD